jgi:hypothetical protein
VPLTRLPSLMNYFPVLLLGCSLKLEEFPLVSTLSACIYHLQIIDWQLFLNNFTANNDPKSTWIPSLLVLH